MERSAPLCEHPRLAVEGTAPEDAERVLRNLIAGAVYSSRGCGLSSSRTHHEQRPPTRAMDPPMPTDAARAARAAALVHLGELSAAGRALVCEPLAPGDEATLAELRDPARRPSEPYGPVAREVLEFPPEVCPLPLAAFVEGLRGARRGSAAGPSGATNEHLRILLDDEEEDTLRLHAAAERIARAELPPPVLAALRVGRIVALRKPSGVVRALVIGDVLRRLDGSWPRPSLPSCSKLVFPSSLGSARELELRRLPASYAQQPKLILVPRSCRSMQLGPLTTCPGLQCWRRCMRSRRCSLCSHMPVNSSLRLATTCGRMTRDAATRYARLRAASRGTPSCLACTPWPHMVPCKLSKHSSRTAKLFCFPGRHLRRCCA